MLEILKSKIRNLIIGFSYGLKNTESDILGQKTTLSESNSVEQKLQQNDLAEALLKGEVTEEVEFLRDRTYMVSDEAKKYKVIIDTVGTTKAVKKMAKKTPPKTFNNDNFNVNIVMDTNEIPSSVLKGFESVGGYGIKNEYPLKFEYEYNPPKFNLDEYVKKIVIRTNDETNETRLDLYVPIFTDSFERLRKLFDNEINKIKNNKIPPINVKFNNVSFISDKAFGVDDLVPFKFKMNNFIGISEFDGRHILTYNVESIGNDEKITDKYKNKKVRDAYENKKPRGTKLNLGVENKDKYTCEKCGCEIDSKYDFRITKQTFGVSMCNDCLNEHNRKNNQ